MIPSLLSAFSTDCRAARSAIRAPAMVTGSCIWAWTMKYPSPNPTSIVVLVFPAMQRQVDVDGDRVVSRWDFDAFEKHLVQCCPCPVEFATVPSNVLCCDAMPRVVTRLHEPFRYMDRLALPSSELHLYVTPLTAHRLFTASLIIAIKFIAEKPPSAFNDV